MLSLLSPPTSSTVTFSDFLCESFFPFFFFNFYFGLLLFFDGFPPKTIYTSSLMSTTIRHYLKVSSFVVLSLIPLLLFPYSNDFLLGRFNVFIHLKKQVGLLSVQSTYTITSSAGVLKILSGGRIYYMDGEKQEMN